MVEAELTYIPYLSKITLAIKTSAGISPITEDSPLSFIFGKFMYDWLEPTDGWNGFFSELSQTVGDSVLKVSFIGTPEDFQELVEAANRAEKNFGLSIELEYALNEKAQFLAGSSQKLKNLTEFINAQAATSSLAEIKPALQGSTNELCEVHVISAIKNFPISNALANIETELNFIENANPNLMVALLEALSRMNNSAVLFVFSNVSTESTTSALCNVAAIVNREEYARIICENLFFVYVDREDFPAPFEQTERDIKNFLSSCGFDKPKILIISAITKSGHSTLEQALSIYAKRYALTVSICKIYSVVKKKLAAAAIEINREISELNGSLQSLRERITDYALPSQPENPFEEFFSAIAELNFDSEDFEQMSRDWLNRLKNLKAPETQCAVNKNLDGRMNTYLKISDAENYAQTVKFSMKKYSDSIFAEVAAYFNARLLNTARNSLSFLEDSDRQPFQDLIADFEKLLADKNLSAFSIDFELMTFWSHEKVGRHYEDIMWVPLDKIFESHQIHTASHLKNQLRKLRIAAANFVSNFRATAETDLQIPARLDYTIDMEYQQLKKGIASKEKTLNFCEQKLNELKNLDRQITRLLEINP